MLSHAIRIDVPAMTAYGLDNTASQLIAPETGHAGTNPA